jgi:hypothetical protein
MKFGMVVEVRVIQMLHQKVNILRNVGDASGTKVVRGDNTRSAAVWLGLHVETELGEDGLRFQKRMEGAGEREGRRRSKEAVEERIVSADFTRCVGLLNQTEHPQLADPFHSGNDDHPVLEVRPLVWKSSVPGSARYNKPNLTWSTAQQKAGRRVG